MYVCICISMAVQAIWRRQSRRRRKEKSLTSMPRLHLLCLFVAPTLPLSTQYVLICASNTALSFFWTAKTAARRRLTHYLFVYILVPKVGFSRT